MQTEQIPITQDMPLSPNPHWDAQHWRQQTFLSSLTLPQFPGRKIFKSHIEVEKENTVKLAKNVEQKKFPTE